MRAAGLLLACAGVMFAQANRSAEVAINAPYVTTPPDVVVEMLNLAGVKATDVVYDLGCGDGRIVIEAARRFKARGVGIDLNPELLAQAETDSRNAGTTSLVSFRRQDIFDADIGNATVVTLYLLPAVNRALRAKLMKELAPGTRIVSHAFDMGDWQPARTITVRGAKLFLWVVPERRKAEGNAAVQTPQQQ